MTPPLLDVAGLTVHYETPQGMVHAVRDVSISVAQREIVGLVGESGCGKSTLSAALLRLLPANGDVASGSVMFGDLDLLTLRESDMRNIRGSRIARIPQDPARALNPTRTIGRHLSDVLNAHGTPRGRALQRTRMCEVLSEVGLPDAPRLLRRYPHELSGGMRQRVAVAMALLLEPVLLIADEPTSALDVTLEAQIIELLRRLRDTHGTAILFVSHHLGVVSHLADRVCVMYAGQVVETGPVDRLYSSPQHPYTRALLAALPDISAVGEPLSVIPGRPPGLIPPPMGCAFAERCPMARDVCAIHVPDLLEEGGRSARCFALDPASDYESSQPMSA
jgi:oligopeptide/dipeptide ABC transporter ATP-binding protein